MRLLFTYGTLKRGYRNHERLQPGYGSEFLGQARTVDPFMLYDNFGKFPGMSEEAGEAPVEGEVYKIDANVMAICDRLEGHPRFYRRKTIKVNLGLDGKTRELTAYAYFIQPPHYSNWQPIGNIWTQLS